MQNIILPAQFLEGKGLGIELNRLIVRIKIHFKFSSSGTDLLGEYSQEPQKDKSEWLAFR